MSDPLRTGRRFLRAVGVAAWLLSGLPALLTLLLPGDLLGVEARLSPVSFGVWLVAAAVYAPAFWITAGQADRERPRRAALPLLALQSLAALVMFDIVCTGFETLLLVVVAAQLGLFVAVPLGLAWVAVQTAGLGWLGIVHWGLPGSLLWAFALGLTLQVMALFLSYFAASQARARHELARMNAELRTTREQLAAAREAAARARIARELHDLLGHHLSALSLHLEAARHRAGEDGREAIERCQSIARLLLADVRQAVQEVRLDPPEDLAASLHGVVADIPRPQVELSVASGLRPADPEREQAIVRCVQEIVTNAVRHADADHLWIELRLGEDGLELEARDDGRGVGEVQPGQGLTGMRERLERLGGSLQIHSTPGEGFELRARLPWS
ncbi:MAG: sensor histidine kinase [Thermoanaerobaculia bacterium]